jgi:hypothetical protein
MTAAPLEVLSDGNVPCSRTVDGQCQAEPDSLGFFLLRGPEIPPSAFARLSCVVE